MNINTKNTKTFKIIIEYLAEGENKEELKERIIKHMTQQSLEMEMSIPTIKVIEEEGDESNRENRKYLEVR